MNCAFFSQSYRWPTLQCRPPSSCCAFPSLTDHLTGDLRLHATRALTGLALHNREYLEQVIAQPWFADGLEDEEAVLVVILERAARGQPCALPRPADCPLQPDPGKSNYL